MTARLHHIIFLSTALTPLHLSHLRSDEKTINIRGIPCTAFLKEVRSFVQCINANPMAQEQLSCHGGVKTTPQIR